MKALYITFLVILLPVSLQAQWFPQSSGTTSNFLRVFFIDSDYGWIGSTQGRVFKTTDGGESWNLYTTNSNKDVLSIHFINQDTGWCVSSTYSGNGVGDIYKTTDGGINWEEKFSYTTILESIYFVNENIGWAVGGAYFIGDQCLKSTDGGDNWMVSHFFGTGVGIREVYFLDKNIGFAVGGGNLGRIYKTIDGGYSWAETLIGNSFQDVSFADSLRGIAAGMHNNLARTTDGGETWEAFQSGHYSGCYGVSNRYPLGWIIIGAPNYILNTSDYGDKWFPQLKTEGIHLSDICFVNDSVGWVVGFDGTILKTVNGGNPIVGLPQIPNLLLPNNGDTLTTLVYFSWEEIEYSAYQLQISSDSLFFDIVVDIRIIQDFYDAWLDTFSKYYWRLRSENINGYSQWSPIRTITCKR